MQFPKTTALKAFLDKNLTFVLFLILAARYLSTQPKSNEEHYLLLSKIYGAPNWINMEVEFPGVRLIYQFVCSNLLKVLSFEQTTFVLSLVLCGMFAFILSKIYVQLNFDFHKILLHFVVLFLPWQSFFAGSWMLIGLEPKGLAYFFVLYAFYFFLKESYNKAIYSLIFASYLHFLVGAWCFAYFALYYVLFLPQALPLKERIKPLLIYAVCLIPLVLYLKSGVVMSVEDNSSPSANYIYSYIRNPHHTGLFKSAHFFYKTHFEGVLTAVVVLIFSIQYYRHIEDKMWKSVLCLGALIIAGSLLLVPVGLIDREGVFLKFYPYRAMTFATFLSMLAAVHFIFENSVSKVHHILKTAICGIAILAMTKPVLINAAHNYASIQYPKSSLFEMSEYVKQNVPKSDEILSFDSELSLTRRFERRLFFVDKFIPAELSKIKTWYQKKLALEAMQEQPQKIATYSTQYGFDYVFSQIPLEFPFLHLEKNLGSYYLYKISK